MLVDAGSPNRSAGVDSDPDDFACGFLHQLWAKDFLRQTAAHAEEDSDDAMKACALREVQEV